jgi:hypothetical protein
MSKSAAEAISAIVHFMLLEHLGLIADDGAMTVTGTSDMLQVAVGGDDEKRLLPGVLDLMITT